MRRIWYTGCLQIPPPSPLLEKEFEGLTRSWVDAEAHSGRPDLPRCAGQGAGG